MVVTVFGVTMVKNEIDVIVGIIQHMCSEVDELLVLDNGSTDGTCEAIKCLATKYPITLFEDPDPAYYQSARMSRLAEIAGEQGATWIVPFDADEIWHHVGELRIRDYLPTVEHQIVNVPIRNHFCTSKDESGSNPFRTMVWKHDDWNPLGKVAFRYRTGAVIHQGNHGVILPGNPPVLNGDLEIRHFPYRSAQQFVNKAVQGAKAYEAASDLDPGMGTHWRMYGKVVEEHGVEALVEHFYAHFYYPEPELVMTYDPAPYCRFY